MLAEAPIGIFDSGFGGLTVAKAVAELLPNEDIVYLGDTAHAPYGTRPLADIRRLALAGLDSLVDRGAKALVIACNSASSAVLRDARERYEVPVVDVVLPAARRAATISRNSRVGVLCTEATARSQAYDDALDAAPVQVTTSPCPAFVDYVESGVTGGPELEAVARKYLVSLQEADVDTVILGCTHYPLLAGLLGYLLGPQVTEVSSAQECAQETYRVLAREGLLREGPRQAHRRFLTTGNPERFHTISRQLLGSFVDVVELLHPHGDAQDPRP